jgi:hypothetical protein
MKAASSDKSIISNYMEDKHGKPVSSERASEIREVASTLWFEMVEKGCALPRWSEAAADVKSFYYGGMDENCQEMRYCHNHWKAQYLATRNYSSFYNNHGHKGPSGVVKQEPDTAIVNAKFQKRSCGDIEGENKDKAPKKPKRTHQDKPNVWSCLLFVNKVIIAKHLNRLPPPPPRACLQPHNPLNPMTTQSLR